MPLLFAATIFLSSFLLFLIQPLIAKQILPWFGGAAAVWTTCLLFFQTLLLGGYVYAHAAVRRLNPRVHALVHAVLLAASLAMLPVLADPSWKPDGSEQPVWRILVLLAATIGLPYFMLSSTGPLVQVWYARALKRLPYRLFALSNAGSLLALLAYPFLVEPWLSTRVQAWIWSAAFALFVVLCVRSAFAGSRDGLHPAASARSSGSAHPSAPRARDYAAWMSLAALASYMLLSVSGHLTQNIAAIPFLWIAPLTLYLLSFILCFDSDGWYRRGPYLALLAVCLAAVAWWFLDSLELKYAIPAHLVALFLICMFCHGEIALGKPDAHYLTGFFLSISLGGVLGSLLVVVVAPLVLPGYFELGFGLAACALAALIRGDRGLAWVRPAFAASLFFVTWSVTTQIRNYWADTDILVAARNFYGAYRVVQHVQGTESLRKFHNGRILHGAQYLEPAERRGEPLTYYSARSGLGAVLEALRQDAPLRVGMIGLGAGTLAAWGRPGDIFRFYEIDPLVVTLAENEFRYLGQSRARIEMAVGDARLSLERELAQQFDLLAIDAFTGDAIPVHLVSAQALEVYLRHLRPGGVLLFHVTNRYLDLAPVVARLAERRGLRAALISHEPSEQEEAAEISSSDWVVVSGNGRLFAQPSVASAATEIKVGASTPLWTDDFNNLLRTLR